MSRTTVRTVATAVAALVGVTLVGVGPASADLVRQNAIFVSSWAGQLHSVDATTGASVPVGSPPAVSLSLGGIELDFLTGEGFAVSYTTAAKLYAITRDGTPPLLIGDLVAANGDVAKYCTGLDVTDGVILVTCDYLGAATDVTGSVDPVTAVLTPLVSETARFSALATDPTTGILYGLSYSGKAFSIDTASSVVTEAGDFGIAGFSIYGADFDSDGVLWASGYSTRTPEISGHALLRFSMEDWSGVGIGALQAGNVSVVNPESLTVGSVLTETETVTPAGPPATLPEMGSGSALLPIGLAGVAVLLGAVLVAHRRRAI